MHIGLIGLGKMGFNLALNIMDHGHRVTAYDVSEEARSRFVQNRGSVTSSISDLVSQLPSPRTVWVMVPHQFVDDVLAELKTSLTKGDIVRPLSPCFAIRQSRMDTASWVRPEADTL